MTNPVPTLLVANASGRIVETRVANAAERLAPVRSLAQISKGNIAMIAGSLALIVFSVYLETFDEAKVQAAILKWQSARDYLVNQDGSFDQAFPDFVSSKLPEEAWNTSDREEFDKFVSHFTNEIVAIAGACNTNADALAMALEKYDEIVDAFFAASVALLLAVIASIWLQFFPPTAAAAQAIGIAGAIAAIGTVAALTTYLVAALSPLALLLNANDAVQFTSISHPGDVSAEAEDPDLKDIAITWVQDSAYYNSGQ